MKTLILSDLHGKDPSKVIGHYTKQGEIDTLAVLGDVDTPKVLRKILDETKRNNLRLIYTPGNHEYCYMFHYGLWSPEMVKTKVCNHRRTGFLPFLHKQRGLTEIINKLDEEYFFEWDSAPQEKQIVLDAIAGTTKDNGLIVREGEVAYAHATLLDHPSKYASCIPDSVLGRILYSEETRTSNLERMRKSGINLLFRGHDHTPRIQIHKGDTLREITEEVAREKLDLKNSQTVVTVGAFYNGNYAVYNPEIQKINLHWWDTERELFI
jgi:hypothetical protein